MEKRLRFVNTITLLGILFVLVLILIRLPQAQHFPTPKDVIEAKGDQARIQELKSEIPLVRVQGTVSVDAPNPNY